MKPILIAYASRHGSTEQVAANVAARLRAVGLDAEVRSVLTLNELDRYAGVIVGAPIYMGRWHRDAVRFLKRHRDTLAELPVAVFALGPRTLEPADVAESRSQLLASLDKVPEVHADPIAVFGGVIDPSKLRFPLSRLPASDARDWDAIDAFAHACSGAHRYGKAAADRRDPRRELQQTPR